MGIESNVFPRIATGFCGGLSRTGGMCGAVSGGVMAIGLDKGRCAPTELADETYEKVQHFLMLFKEQYGSLNCCDLVGVDTSTEQGRTYARQNGLYARCRIFSSEAVGMVLETL